MNARTNDGRLIPVARKRPRITYNKAKSTDRPNKDGALRHAMERAEERTGLTLGKSAQTKIIRRIMNKDGKCLDRQPDGREIWLIQYAGEPVFPVFDRVNKVIVTVLPADHEVASRHYANVKPAAQASDPRLNVLAQAADELGIKQDAPASGVRIIIGADARHSPTGLEGEVLEADMARRTLTIRAGETGTLEDRIPCFAGPALKPV